MQTRNLCEDEEFIIEELEPKTAPESLAGFLE